MQTRIGAALAAIVMLCGAAAAQQQDRKPYKLIDAIETELAGATRECRTINQHKTRHCVLGYRVRVTSGQLIIFHFEDWRFEFANFMKGKGIPSFQRVPLNGVQPEIVIDRVAGVLGEKETAAIVLKCREGKCVGAETGQNYEKASLHNIDNTGAARRVRAMLTELIALCRETPKACD